MPFLLMMWLYQTATTAQYSVSTKPWQLLAQLLMMEQSLLSLFYLF